MKLPKFQWKVQIEVTRSLGEWKQTGDNTKKETEDVCTCCSITSDICKLLNIQSNLLVVTSFKQPTAFKGQYFFVTPDVHLNSKLTCIHHASCFKEHFTLACHWLFKTDFTVLFFCHAIVLVRVVFLYAYIFHRRMPWSVYRIETLTKSLQGPRLSLLEFSASPKALKCAMNSLPLAQ